MSELTERQAAGERPDDEPDDGAVAPVEAPPAPDEEVAAPPATGGPEHEAAEQPSWAVRAGRRIVRRPVRWGPRPWTTSRTVRFAVTAVTLVITTVIMMNVVHLNPLNMKADLIF